MILRCTKKLLSIIGPVPVSEPTPDAEDWYPNLLWFDRRKCLLLTHVSTLFTILEADINVLEVRSTGSFIAALVKRELLSEGLPPDTFDLDMEEVVYPRRLTGAFSDV